MVTTKPQHKNVRTRALIVSAALVAASMLAITPAGLLRVRLTVGV